MSNKTILKNTGFLYIRMIITMFISLYTSRVIIDALGFTDYGIYSVVGGVVGLISFMHASLAGATTRFMNVELGKKNVENLKSVFNSAVIIHVSLALFIFIVAETVGLWYFYHRLNVPEGRTVAAMWVFQFSIISVMMTIIQTPYDAAIIAHQKMSIYAYISILEAVLKLIIAYLVYVLPYDKLIVYAALILLVSIIVRLTYQIYCRKNFEECKFQWAYNKSYVKSISSFFGWDLYGNFAWMTKSQGIVVLINQFFPTVVNAAVSISNQVLFVLSSFSYNLLLAIKPQITQSYAVNDMRRVTFLTKTASLISFSLFLLLSLPFYFNIEFFLNLWLKNVPIYTVLFVKLNIFFTLISSVFNPLLFVLQARGEMKLISFYTGTLYILSLPLSYYLFLKGFPPESTFIINITISFLIGIVYLLLIKNTLPSFDLNDYLKNVLLRCFIIFCLSFLLGYFICEYFKNSTLLVMFLTNVIYVLLILGIFLFVLQKEVKLQIQIFLKDKIYNLIKRK